MVVESLEPLPGPLAFFVGFASWKHASFRYYRATGPVRAVLPRNTARSAVTLRPPVLRLPDPPIGASSPRFPRPPHLGIFYEKMKLSFSVDLPPF